MSALRQRVTSARPPAALMTACNLLAHMEAAVSDSPHAAIRQL
jgi:hypothetical protein